MNFPGRMIIFGKLRTVLVALACLVVSNICLAQDVPVSLSVRNVSFEHLFKEITKQTGYMFLYDTETLQQIKPFSIHVKKMPLTKMLDLCFIRQPLSYNLVDKMIIVKQKDLVVTKVVKTGRATLNGIVKDDQTNNPMQGATVRLYSTNGSVATVSTDNSGHYSFAKVIPGNYKIVFNFIGYAVTEKDFSLVDGQHQIYDVVLQGITGHLDDVVVIGYGQVRNGDLTGSVSSVSPKDIKDIPSMSFDDALAGKVPGLQVTKADGSPGGAVKMNLRGGISLLGTNDPLYIIDGIPVSVNNLYIQTSVLLFDQVESRNISNINYIGNAINGSYNRGTDILTGIDISDIESIDVLKDASSSAIYGSKAANGVVIITTKSGKLNSKPVVNFNYYVGVNTPILPKLLNTEQYEEITDEALQNTYHNDQVSLIADSTINTNWLKLITRKAVTQNADLSLSGGGTSSSYYVSTAYANEQGVLIGTGFKRFAGKANFEHHWTSRFRLLSNFNMGYTLNDINSGIYGQALYAAPDYTPYNADGSLNLFSGPGNPLAFANIKNRGTQYIMLGKIALEFDWLKNLKLRSTVSINYTDYHQLQLIPSYIQFFYQNGYTGSGSFGANASAGNADILYENTVTWDSNLKKGHQLNLLAGTSWETDRSHDLEAETGGFPDGTPLNQIPDLINSNKLYEQNFASSNNLLSFYARANYNYKHNYLFTFTGRADASSKYPAANKVGYFPSAAFAWRISGEHFLKDESWIDDIKLRISAGKTGLNANIGDNLYSPLYYNTSYAGSKAIVQTQAESTDFKWESVWQNDIGVDFSLFKSRLNGTIGYYRKITSGLLLGVDAPSSASSALLIENTAGIANKGLELNLQGNIIRSGKFIWDMSFNLAHNTSKVTGINGNPFSDPLYRTSTLGTSIVEEGKPLGLLYGYRVLGILKTQAEVDQYEKEFPTYQTWFPLLGVGDYKYELTPSGTPKEDIIGDGNPQFYGGLMQNLTLGNFSLAVSMTYSYGNQLLYQNDVNNMEVNDYSNKEIAILNRFTPQNTNTDRPRVIYGQGVLPSNENVYDASYVKMRSLTLNYKFPDRVIKKIKMRNLSVYITGTNLFTITKYPGPDPEVSDDPRSTIGGYNDVSTYPTTRSYIIGVRAGF
jgi:TonB-linked SusC/RagA family outer membrane protein